MPTGYQRGPFGGGQGGGRPRVIRKPPRPHPIPPRTPGPHPFPPGADPGSRRGPGQIPLGSGGNFRPPQVPPQQGVKGNLNYGGDVPLGLDTLPGGPGFGPSFGGGYGGPGTKPGGRFQQGGGGQGGGGRQLPQQRPGVSDKWLQGQMQDFRQRYNDNRGQMFGNQGFGPAQMRRLLNEQSDLGLGRKGINYLLDNQQMQQALMGGRTGGPLKGITPDLLRQMMQSGQFKGGVNQSNWGDAQGALFDMSPDMYSAYTQGLGPKKVDPQTQAQYDRLVAHYAQIGQPIPQGTIDAAMRQGVNLTGNANIDPRIYSALQSRMYDGSSLGDTWTNWATNKGYDVGSMQDWENYRMAQRNDPNSTLGAPGAIDYSGWGIPPDGPLSRPRRRRRGY